MRSTMPGPSYRPDWHQVRDLVSDKTRLIIVNTPHNPTGSVWHQEDLNALREIVADRQIYVVSDEVYEHIVFDDRPHLSMCADEVLRERSFAISSFGKTYHVTGWKVGYCVAPEVLTTEFRRVHQFVNFTVNTPMQLGLADFLASHPEHHLRLPEFYQAKRDHFCNLLSGSRFKVQPSEGTYFQLLDYSEISQEVDTQLAHDWTKAHKVASIPVSVFYPTDVGQQDPVLRFCFAKDDATLEQAAEILCSL